MLMIKRSQITKAYKKPPALQTTALSAFIDHAVLCYNIRAIKKARHSDIVYKQPAASKLLTLPRPSYLAFSRRHNV